MKKFKLEGTNATLLKSMDKKRIRKAKIKGLCPYMRVVPENKILKLLEGSNVRHPRFIKNGLKYVEMEFIEGKPLPDNIDKSILIGLLCNYVYEMSKIDTTSISKYSRWTNSSTFLYTQINNILSVVKESNHIDKLKELNVNFNGLLSLKNVKLDDNRKLSLIHGDITKKNILSNNGIYTLIDWELSCKGDIAYDLALHFVNEEYTQDDIKIVMDRLCGSLLLNPETLVKDIKIYMQLEYYRKTLVGFIEAIDLNNKKISNEELLKQTYKYYSKITPNISLDRVKMIINK